MPLTHAPRVQAAPAVVAVGAVGQAPGHKRLALRNIATTHTDTYAQVRSKRRRPMDGTVLTHVYSNVHGRNKPWKEQAMPLPFPFLPPTPQRSPPRPIALGSVRVWAGTYNPPQPLPQMPLLTLKNSRERSSATSLSSTRQSAPGSPLGMHLHTHTADTRLRCPRGRHYPGGGLRARNPSQGLTEAPVRPHSISFRHLVPVVKSSRPSPSLPPSLPFLPSTPPTPSPLLLPLSPRRTCSAPG